LDSNRCIGAGRRSVGRIVLLVWSFATLCVLGPRAARAAEAGGASAAGAAGATGAADSLSLDALRGQVVLVDFWASWCAPCRESFPWLSEIAQRYADSGLVLVAVNVDKKRADADAFLAKHRAKLRVVYDPDGRIASAFALKGMPVSFLYDRKGTLRETHIGFKKGDTKKREESIRALLAEKESEDETALPR